MRAFATLMLLAIAGPAIAAPGDLISSEELAGAPAGAQAWRITYQTTGERGEALTSTGVVVAPLNRMANRPMLAWAHGTWGVVDKCAPSASPNVFRATPALPEMLARGYVVVATDYAGLGTPGVHGYMIGDRVAHSVIDAVRATRKLQGAGVGNRFAVWGESEGAHAALFTGFNTRKYAPGLDLVGIAAAAPPTDLLANLGGGSNRAVAALLTAFVIHSWAELYAIDTRTIVKPATGRLIDRLAQNNCISLDAKPRLGTVLGVGALQAQLRSVDLAKAQPWARIARANSAPVRRPDAPLLIYQNGGDAVVAPAITRSYALKMCRAGVPLRYVFSAGSKHETSAADSATLTLDWIGNRFDGRPARNDCGKF